MLLTPQESVKIRESFPALKDLIFLNSASVTPFPKQCRDALNKTNDQRLNSAYLELPGWERLISEARAMAASMMGCSPEETAFVKNTAQGLSFVASGLDLKPGDEVIVNDLEFPSNVYPWLNLERKGVKVTIAKSSGGRITPDMIAPLVTARTRVLAISSVQYATGYRADLASLGQMARDKGFLLVVDAIQSMGVIPMDVKALGIHFLSAGGFKWLCGPIGTGMFFCDGKMLDSLSLITAGWNSVKNAGQYDVIDFTLRETAQRFEEGSGNFSGTIGLLESMKLLTGVGIGKIESHALDLNLYLAERLKSRGLEVLSSMEDGERSGILIFKPQEGQSPESVFKGLESRNILVSPRGGGVRVSPHFFNTTEDMDRLLEVL